MDTISRPYTAHSVYSLVSRKTPIQNEDNLAVPRLDVIAESKYGNFLDTQNQAGSTWNVPPPPKKINLSINMSKEETEYFSKVERIKLEHYNMRTRLVKYLLQIEAIGSNEVRRPSRFHLKCPVCLEYAKSSFELSD